MLVLIVLFSFPVCHILMKLKALVTQEYGQKNLVGKSYVKSPLLNGWLWVPHHMTGNLWYARFDDHFKNILYNNSMQQYIYKAI